MILVWNLHFQTVLLRSELLHGGIEEQMDLTILTRRGGVDYKGPGSPGKARWRDRVILDGRVRGFGRGGGFGEVKKR